LFSSHKKSYSDSELHRDNEEKLDRIYENASLKNENESLKIDLTLLTYEKEQRQQFASLKPKKSHTQYFTDVNYFF